MRGEIFIMLYIIVIFTLLLFYLVSCFYLHITSRHLFVVIMFCILIYGGIFLNIYNMIFISEPIQNNNPNVDDVSDLMRNAEQRIDNPIIHSEGDLNRNDKPRQKQSIPNDKPRQKQSSPNDDVNDLNRNDNHILYSEWDINRNAEQRRSNSNVDDVSDLMMDTEQRNDNPIINSEGDLNRNDKPLQKKSNPNVDDVNDLKGNDNPIINSEVVNLTKNDSAQGNRPNVDGVNDLLRFSEPSNNYGDNLNDLQNSEFLMFKDVIDKNIELYKHGKYIKSLLKNLPYYQINYYNYEKSMINRVLKPEIVLTNYPSIIEKVDNIDRKPYNYDISIITSKYFVLKSGVISIECNKYIEVSFTNDFDYIIINPITKRVFTINYGDFSHDKECKLRLNINPIVTIPPGTYDLKFKFDLKYVDVNGELYTNSSKHICKVVIEDYTMYEKFLQYIEGVNIFIIIIGSIIVYFILPIIKKMFLNFKMRRDKCKSDLKSLQDESERIREEIIRK